MSDKLVVVRLGVMVCVTPPISTVMELKSVVAAGFPKLTPERVPVCDVPRLTPAGVPTVTLAEGAKDTLDIVLPLAELTVRLLALVLVVPVEGADTIAGVNFAEVTESELPVLIIKLLLLSTLTVSVEEDSFVRN